MKKTILFLLLFFTGIAQSFAAQILVENIFSDIDSDYIYRDELQALYDRGMIIPDESGTFGPNEYLNRDEFVGIAMEVICERCIQPHTEYKYISEYSGKDVYFDIDESNAYFYCVAEADKQNYVRGYDASQVCQNGTSQFGSRPFCPINKINLEEAVAVLLRNSGIFTISDNQAVIEQIYAGNITGTLGNDVSPTDDEGNPYTFYGYIRKALDYEITEYDTAGNEKTLKLLELDASGNINPDTFVTKQEFLRMSYIALKSNNCSSISDAGLALRLDVLEKSCTPGDTDCDISDLNDPDDTYDFQPEVEGVCELGIDNPTGYVWRFQNLDTGEQYIRYGNYIDNYTLPSEGEWRVYVRVIDNCGNTSEVYSTIFVDDITVDNPEVDEYIDVDIDVYDDDCIAPGTTCTELEFEDEEDDGDDIFDFDGDVSTSCNVGSVSYDWTFTHVPSSTVFNYTGEYINDFDFSLTGEWLIYLEVRDGCGQTGSEQMTYIVVDNPEVDEYIDVDIDVYDDDCSAPGTNCEEIEFEDEEDDGDDIFDFDGDVSTSCNVGNVSYDWTFTHVPSSTVFNYSGEYINDFDFSLTGEWLIYLEVRDGCGQTGSEQMTYIVVDNPEVDEYIDVDIDVYDDDCSAPGTTCTELEFEDEEDDGDDIFDFDGDVSTSCTVGTTTYDWTFTHVPSSTVFNYSGEYINDFDFSLTGEWLIYLEVRDGCGQTGSEQMTYIVVDNPEVDEYIDVDIDVYDDDCSAPGTNCEEIEFEDEEDDGDDIFDFDGDVSTSCNVGNVSYNWTFTHPASSTYYTFSSEYVNDFEFILSGLWVIVLEVQDGCGQTGREQMNYIVRENSVSLDVSIGAVPIYGEASLLTDFEALVSGGVGPYIYSWDFGDLATDFGETVSHLYTTPGTYTVTLTVTDSWGNTGTATVVIQVIENENICENDSDGDGVGDCEDLCPTVEGDAINYGCPIFDTQCDESCGCPEGYTCDDSDPLTCGSGICVPDVPDTSSCLFTPGMGSIFGGAVCSSCPCQNFLDFKADIRKCDLVFPAITSPDGSDIYSRGNIWQITN